MAFRAASDTVIRFVRRGFQRGALLQVEDLGPREDRCCVATRPWLDISSNSNALCSSLETCAESAH